MNLQIQNMKTINNYIIEKFKINSVTANQKVRKLAELFGLEFEEAKYLNKYIDPEEPLFDFKNPICLPLEALLMLAFILIDDNMPFDYYKILGTKLYKQKGGKGNPYDWSWFEEEEDDAKDGKDYLDHVVKWINEHENEFKKIYNIVKKYKKNFNTEKIFWEIQEII